MLFQLLTSCSRRYKLPEHLGVKLPGLLESLEKPSYPGVWLKGCVLPDFRKRSGKSILLYSFHLNPLSDWLVFNHVKRNLSGREWHLRAKTE